MKEVFKSKIIVLLLPLMILLGCNPREDQQHTGETRYTCPMHPQIVTGEPGKCPICKMDLVPITQTEHGSVDSLAFIVKPTEELVQSQIETVKPSVGKRFGDVTLKGAISFNTSNWNTISSRVSGRIERLYVRYNNQSVRRGQKLMDIYSPDLVNAQQELLFLSRQGQAELLGSARRKLSVLGMSEGQIQQVLRTGKVSYLVSVYSPYSGYLAEAPATTGSTTTTSAGGISGTQSGGSMDGMGSSVAPAEVPSLPVAAANNAPLLLREGQYVSIGQKLFTLMDPSKVWAEFFASAEQLDEFKRGTAISIASADAPEMKTTSSVNLIQPYYKEGSRFSLIRAIVPNANGQWRVGQLVRISKETAGVSGTWLPRTAVVQLGTRAVAFVKRPGGFVPVQLKMAEQSGDWVNIGQSLPQNAEVARNAWFLVDSESFIKVDTLKK